MNDGAQSREGTRTDIRVRTRDGFMACTTAGSGEPVLLVHGLGGDRHTWNEVLDDLARHHTVVAPDLPGHGESDAPAGDYSLGAHATALRDLLTALGHDSATVVGHSLGGGVALRFAYQFPQHLDRLILISTGGLGPEVTPMLRAATVPGAGAVVAALAHVPPVLTRLLLPVAARVPGLVSRQDTTLLAAGLRRLAGDRQRQAFLRTARAVIDLRGQAVTATRHLDVLGDVPTFLAWGSDDQTIPPEHHRELARRVPDVRALELAGAGHFPHQTAADRLLPFLHDFMSHTTPYRYDLARWRRRLVSVA